MYVNLVCKLYQVVTDFMQFWRTLLENFQIKLECRNQNQIKSKPKYHFHL
uniref:Uncharacterized protein n=1 Tax=Rhizophora mucronata TaxID=61149 RepID=A0A2P2LY44_RHIMU